MIQIFHQFIPGFQSLNEIFGFSSVKRLRHFTNITVLSQRLRFKSIRAFFPPLFSAIASSIAASQTPKRSSVRLSSFQAIFILRLSNIYCPAFVTLRAASRQYKVVRCCFQYKYSFHWSHDLYYARNRKLIAEHETQVRCTTEISGFPSEVSDVPKKQ